MTNTERIVLALERIAAALERMEHRTPPVPNVYPNIYPDPVPYTAPYRPNVYRAGSESAQ